MIEADVEFLRTITAELSTESVSLAEEAAVVQRTMTNPAHRQFMRRVIRCADRTKEIADFQQANLENWLDELAASPESSFDQESCE